MTNKETTSVLESKTTKHSIKHLFHINAKRSDVYKAISTIHGLSNWWTTQTSGNADPGGIIEFRFADHGGPDMKVKSTRNNELVVWECVGNKPEWAGHIFTFKLDDNEGKSRVRFSHEGWDEDDEFYAICSFAWSRYMESLRQFCETGKGAPFGSEINRQ